MPATVKLQQENERLVEKYHVPGAILAVSKNGEKVHLSQLGYANKEDEICITEDSVLGLASVTKSFTCAALLHLQEAGKLNVQDKVTKYLPDFRLKNNQYVDEITIHHFMTHSSGLPPMFALEYAMKRPDPANPGKYNHVGTDQNQSPLHTYEDLMEYIYQSGVRLYAKPGKQFSYSNEAYSLLGAIIEKVSGQSYETYIYENITEPCGMMRTKFTFEELGEDENISASYGKNEGSEEIVTDNNWAISTSMQATGFLKSTTNDMLKYADFFLNKGKVNGKQILSAESVKAMTTPQVKVHLGQYYGYGFRIIPDYFGNTFIGHGGALRSVSSRFGFIPEKGLAGIVLANLIGFPASTLLDAAFKTFLGYDIDAQLSKAYAEHKVDEATLATYAGQYKSDEGSDITLKVDDGKFIFGGRDGDYPTKFINETDFITFFNDSEEIMEILLDDNGKPYALSCYSRVVHKVE